MGQIVIACFMLLAAGVVAVRYVDGIGQGPAVAAVPAASTVAYNSRSITIPRAMNGHFTTDARVDGVRLSFVVDTGATHIALRQSEAARLGLRPSARDYRAKVQTANGIINVAVVDLNTVEVGGVIVRDLKALVHPDAGLAENLLGMSFLSRVRWTYDRGRLLLEQ